MSNDYEKGGAPRQNVTNRPPQEAIVYSKPKKMSRTIRATSEAPNDRGDNHCNQKLRTKEHEGCLSQVLMP